jgi:hypothetical protein
VARVIVPPTVACLFHPDSARRAWQGKTCLALQDTRREPEGQRSARKWSVKLSY